MEISDHKWLYCMIFIALWIRRHRSALTCLIVTAKVKEVNRYPYFFKLTGTLSNLRYQLVQLVVYTTWVNDRYMSLLMVPLEASRAELSIRHHRHSMHVPRASRSLGHEGATRPEQKNSVFNYFSCLGHLCHMKAGNETRRRVRVRYVTYNSQ
jgi:hypothetical protein